MRKKTKKIVFVFCAVILLVWIFDFVLNCDMSKESFNYIQNDNGTIVLTEYLGNKKYVLVPSVFDEKQVVSLQRTFFDNKTIEKVYIQPGVIVIDEAVFWGCKSLKTVHIPDTVERLGSSSFAYSGIQRINIAQVTEVGSFCFNECKELYYFVSETKDILHLRGYSFFNSGLTYMIIENNPQYDFTTFSQKCIFGTDPHFLIKFLCFIPGFTQILYFASNHDIHEWVFIFLFCGFLLALAIAVLYKSYIALCGALNKNSYQKYRAQEIEILNKTNATNGINTFSCFKKTNRISSRSQSSILLFLIFIYIYIAILFGAEIAFDLSTSFGINILILFFVLLAPIIFVTVFKLIRAVYRTIRLRKFDLPVKPNLRILNFKKRRYKYDK